MPEISIDKDRYGKAPLFVLVEATHNAVQDIVRRKLAESGLAWRDFVFGAADELIDAEVIAGVEKRILESGHRFAASSNVSLRDRPEIYAGAAGLADDADFSFEHPQAQVGSRDAEGREQRGTGDNVVQRSSNVIGKACYVRTSEKVLELMKNGVPDDTIAIIDDSGGTLTAPILERFKGVICAGGTVRSHLGILTREYNIPCLMNARISGIRAGDIVEIETSAPARSVESYQSGQECPARIWKRS